MDLGERIKSLRTELNLSREEFAHRFGIAYSTLSKYETNARFPDKDTLKKLADFFDVSIDYLLCRTDVKNSQEKDSIDFGSFTVDNIKNLKREKNIMFNGEPASDEEIECILQAIEVGAALAKKKRENR